jgi:hypothetical protein
MTVIKGIFILFLVVTFISGIYISGTYTSPYKEGWRDNSGNWYSDSSGNVGKNNNDPDLNNRINQIWDNKDRNDFTYNKEFDRKIKQDSNSEKSCPDLLIRKGNVLLLYNSKKPEMEGINPIPFYNLDEYIYYLEIQRKNGLQCPILYLQEEEGTQGKSTYRIRQSPFIHDGLPSNVDLYRNPIPFSALTSGDDNPPYNANQHMSFDPYGQYIGKYTDIDALHDSTFKGAPISENPMDSNWGGVLYTKTIVDSGKYKENEVAPPTSMGPWKLPSDNIRTGVDAQKLDIYA